MAINIVMDFCTATGMELNFSKTKYTTNDEQKLDLSKFPGMEFLKPNQQYKYLGYYISLDLNWDPHIKFFNNQFKPH